MSDLSRLEALTRLILDREMAALSDLNHKLARNRADHRNLSRARQEVGLADDLSDALPRGNWEAWTRAQQQRLSEQAARMATRREEQMVRTRRAFGRSQAVAGLRGKFD